MDPGDFFPQLQEAVSQLPVPVITVLARRGAPPFQLLAATLLSLRTRDAATTGAAQRLFLIAPDPAALLQVGVARVEEAIYPVGFYRVKARQLYQIAGILVEEYAGEVPADRAALLRLPGVGIKTANLVLIHGFNKEFICVDIHVHRISNRIGLIKTGSPEESETHLYKVLPRDIWKVYNDVLVAFGQSVCTPLSPHCSLCPLAVSCPALGVGRKR